MLRGKNKRRFVKNESGMTLIEVAIGMIVLGLMLAAIMPFYKEYKYRKIRDNTFRSLGEIQTSMARYALINGGYPPPAPRNINYGNANYGISISTASVPGLGACVINDPSVCKVTGTSDKAGAVGNDPVIRGDVPFATLGLPFTSSIDGYGNRITYAVSEYLTRNHIIPFDTNNGVIRVQDNAGTFVQAPPRIEVTDDAHYTLISHGLNGIGSFTKSGVLRSACAPADTDQGRDRENCDLDAIYTNNFMLERHWSGFDNHVQGHSFVQGTNYYDDSVVKAEFLSQGDWLRQGNSLSSSNKFMPDSLIPIKLGDRNSPVSYYVDNTPFARLNLNEAGQDLTATRIMVNKLCDTNDTGYVVGSCNEESLIGIDGMTGEINDFGANTFNPALIGDDDQTSGSFGVSGTSKSTSGGINCGSGSGIVMTGIAFSEEVCQTDPMAVTTGAAIKTDLKFNAGGCPPGLYARGVLANGDLDCQVP